MGRLRRTSSQEGASAVVGGVAKHVEVVSGSTTSVGALFFPRLMMSGKESEVVSELSSIGLEAATGTSP